MTTKGRKSKNSVRAACDLAREQEAIDQSATRAQASPSGSVSDASVEVCSDSDDAEGELANQAAPAAAGTVNTKESAERQEGAAAAGHDATATGSDQDQVKCLCYHVCG